MLVSALGFGLSESDRVDPKFCLHGIHGLVLTVRLCVACGLSPGQCIFDTDKADELCRNCRLHQQAHTDLIDACISRCSCAQGSISQHACVYLSFLRVSECV